METLHPPENVVRKDIKYNLALSRCEYTKHYAGFMYDTGAKTLTGGSCQDIGVSPGPRFTLRL